MRGDMLLGEGGIHLPTSVPIPECVPVDAREQWASAIRLDQEVEPDDVVMVLCEHPNERVTAAVCASVGVLAAHKGVKVAVANDRSFWADPVNGRWEREYGPHGSFTFAAEDPYGNDAERRSAEVSAYVRRGRLGVAIHASETEEPFVFYGPKASPEVVYVGRALGSVGVKVAQMTRKGSFTTRNPNTLGVELAGEFTLDRLIDLLPSIVDGSLAASASEYPELTELVLVGPVTIKEALELGLTLEYPDFAELSDDDLRKLGFTPGIQRYYAAGWSRRRYSQISNNGILGDLLTERHKTNPKVLAWWKPNGWWYTGKHLEEDGQG